MELTSRERRKALTGGRKHSVEGGAAFESFTGASRRLPLTGFAMLSCYSLNAFPYHSLEASLSPADWPLSQSLSLDTDFLPAFSLTEQSSCPLTQSYAYPAWSKRQNPLNLFPEKYRNEDNGWSAYDIV